MDNLKHLCHVQLASRILIIDNFIYFLYSALNQLTTSDCQDIIKSVGLSKHIEAFSKEGVDGPMLEAFLNPQLGIEMMISVGITEEKDRMVLVREIYRIRARGYNCMSATSTSIQN